MNINSFDEFDRKYFDEIINSYLITKNVRKAFLLQPIDYGESSKHSPTTKRILKRIKALFPSLKQTPMAQGILITKEDISSEEYNSDEGMAKILGFPCVMSRDTVKKYGYSVGIKKFDKKYSLISYVCDKKIYDENQQLLNKVKEALSELDLKDVYLTETRFVSPEEILDLLENSKPFSTEEMDELLNFFFNMNFPDEFNKKFIKVYQHTNQVHRGIVITLVNYFKDDILQVFYPLDPESEIYTNLVKKTQILSNSILKSLENTRLRNKNNTRKNK